MWINMTCWSEAGYRTESTESWVGLLNLTVHWKAAGSCSSSRAGWILSDSSLATSCGLTWPAGPELALFNPFSSVTLLVELKLSFTQSTSSTKLILTIAFILPTILMHLTVLSYNYNRTIPKHTHMHISSMVHPICGTTSILLPLISSLLLRGSNRVTPLQPSHYPLRGG